MIRTILLLLLVSTPAAAQGTSATEPVLPNEFIRHVDYDEYVKRNGIRVRTIPRSGGLRVLVGLQPGSSIVQRLRTVGCGDQGKFLGWFMTEVEHSVNDPADASKGYTVVREVVAGVAGSDVVIVGKSRDGTVVGPASNCP